MSKRKGQARPRKRPGPDDNLAREQFAHLNRQFYSAKLQPHDYLLHRYRALFLAAQSPDVLPCAFNTEMAIGEVRATWTTDEGWDEREAQDYVSTESTVLMHHTAEALFRLYFAHVDNPECPWLGVARLRHPSQFKDRLNRFTSDVRSEANGESAMRVFYGHGTAPEEDKEETWKTLRDALISLLAALGRRLLDEAAMYNSAKHGLSLVPGAAVMELGDQDGPLPIRADGPSITYLTVTDREQGKRWAQETVWLKPPQTLALVLLALYQLGNLWHVAKCHYSGEKYDPTKMRYLTPELLSGVLRHGLDDSQVRVEVPSITIDLLYHAIGDSPTKRSR